LQQGLGTVVGGLVASQGPFPFKSGIALRCPCPEVVESSRASFSFRQLVASQGRGPIVLLGFIPVPDSFALPPGPVWIVEFDAPAESFNGYQLVNAISGELEGGGRTHY